MNLTRLQQRALQRLSREVPPKTRKSVPTEANSGLLSLRRMTGLANLGLVSFTEDGEVRPTPRGRKAV
ncbi:MAG: hypothetical protein HC875_15215 [Anaerolineales bacterium]|nr:hypothetical protein [Anaerolineales bacterium]